MNTPSVCTFTGQVSKARIAGAGRALLLDDDVFKNNHVAWLKLIGPLNNAKIDGRFNDERRINPINANPDCKNFYVSYSTGIDDKDAGGPTITIEVEQGGENGRFVGMLPDARDCSRGCTVDWGQGTTKTLVLAPVRDASATLAGPMPMGEKGECTPQDGGVPPLLGLDRIEAWGVVNGELRCDNHREPVVGDWILLPSSARELKLVRLDIRGGSLFIEAMVDRTNMLRPTMSELLELRRREPKPHIPLVPFPWLEIGGSALFAVAMLALVFWKWPRRMKSRKPLQSSSPKPPRSLDLYIDGAKPRVRVSARGSRGEHIEQFTLPIEYDRVVQFAKDVEQAAGRRKPANGDAARKMHEELLGGAVGKLFAKLEEAADGDPVLLRLLVSKDLQTVPWEASCLPGKTSGYLGTSSKLLPVRGVASDEPWKPPEIREKVNVLAIAPLGEWTIERLRHALKAREEAGQVRWLDPIVGDAARIENLPQLLRARDAPHIVHFLGHGMLDGNVPKLRMADEDGEERWLDAETFAKYLRNRSSSTLRLAVLQACELGRPGQTREEPTGQSEAFASAAEALAQAGIDAVVAHLWPISADAAATCSLEFYQALMTDAGGDVARAMSAARLAVLGTYEQSAEAFSSVLYLRGSHGHIFDFERRSS